MSEDTSGFYKMDESGELLHAPRGVFSTDYTLLRGEHDRYRYPIDGWSWYDSIAFVDTGSNSSGSVETGSFLEPTEENIRLLQYQLTTATRERDTYVSRSIDLETRVRDLETQITSSEVTRSRG